MIGYKINGKNIDAEDIYHLLSNGEYFKDDKEAKKYLKDILKIPVLPPLIWNEFYNYSVQGFRLSSFIFDLIQEIKKSEKYKKLEGSSEIKSYRCIYCLSSEGDFISEEHIFPEALGNNELILPKGYVCDKCNNTKLSELDNFLISFEPIAFLRVWYVPYSKDGKLPKANFQNLSIQKKKPRHLFFNAKDKTGIINQKETLENGLHSLNIKVKGSKINIKLLGRSLYKIALGAIAYDQGMDEACKAKYNKARDFIIKDEGFPNNLLMRMFSQPIPQVRISHYNMPTGTPFSIDIFGIVFLLNLENTPIMQLNEVLKQKNFTSFELWN